MKTHSSKFVYKILKMKFARNLKNHIFLVKENTQRNNLHCFKLSKNVSDEHNFFHEFFSIGITEKKREKNPKKKRK